MIANLMSTVMNFAAGNAWNSSFWGEPAGLFILIVIGVCSAGLILTHCQYDTFLDKLYYTACAIACFATLLHVINDSLPYNVVKTLLLLMTFRLFQVFVTRVTMRVKEWRAERAGKSKAGRALKIDWHAKG